MNDAPTQTPGSAGARREIVIVHHDETALMRLAVALAHNGFGVTAMESEHPLEAVRAALRNRPAAIVVALDGSDDVDEIAGFATGATDTRLLFLTPGSPNAASVARLNSSSRATVVSGEDSSAVIVAALIALLATRTVSA